MDKQIKIKDMSKSASIQHIAFIMDGNRRWAKSKGLTSFQGHKEGYNRLKSIGQACLERGIKYITVYAFSVENWNRSKPEVNYLMWLLKRVLTKDLNKFHQDGLKVRVIGNVKDLSKELRLAIKKAMQITAKNNKGVLNIALNYGGRQEIIAAVKQLIKDKIPVAKITLNKFASYLDTANLPDPDLIIRTSGELRLSNFLLWQCAYSELYFTPCYWPDFSTVELDQAILEFEQRQRRYGR